MLILDFEPLLHYQRGCHFRTQVSPPLLSLPVHIPDIQTHSPNRRHVYTTSTYAHDISFPRAVEIYDNQAFILIIMIYSDDEVKWVKEQSPIPKLKVIFSHIPQFWMA
jgi:hypothetical protein